jgi:Glycosyltransferase (GlcNAc)
VVARLKERADCPRFHQIRQVSIFHINAQGPLYARSLVHKALGNEEYCMQVDAHTGFSKGYDSFLKKQWRSINNEFAVISHTPPALAEKQGYEPGGVKANEVTNQCAVHFRDNGFPVGPGTFDIRIVAASN